MYKQFKEIILPRIINIHSAMFIFWTFDMESFKTDLFL